MHDPQLFLFRTINNHIFSKFKVFFYSKIFTFLKANKDLFSQILLHAADFGGMV